MLGGAGWDQFGLILRARSVPLFGRTSPIPVFPSLGGRRIGNGEGGGGGEGSIRGVFDDMDAFSFFGQKLLRVFLRAGQVPLFEQ